MGSPMQIVEVGTLRTRDNDESNFIGSSTGVYFVNTVRNAFKATKDSPTLGHHAADESALHDPEQEGPNPLEDFLLDDSASQTRSNTPSRANALASSTIPRGPSYDAAPPGIGRPPDAATSKKLLVLYFKLWHPLFPFLHGPTFIQGIEALYDPSKPVDTPPGNEPDRHRCCRAIIAQCVFNVAQAGTSKEILPRYSRIESSHSLIFSLSSLATKQDLHSLQALFAAQLYFVTAGSFRSASAIGGLLAKSLFHSGLHRCPYRYAQLTENDRDLRKRLFWSAYILDRYLSQGLGIPLGFQDSDIDVCMPGKEQHKPINLRGYPATFSREESTSSATSSAEVDGRGREDSVRDGSENVIDGRFNNVSRSGHESVHRDIVLSALVGYSQLTGRAVELFHKSIHVRSVDHTKILYITANIHSWYNSLPMVLTSSDTVMFPNGEPPDEMRPSFVPLFTVLYQQLLLLVNRPYLSLPTSSPEFQSSMQTCIGASRTILGALEMQLQLRQPFFLPELLSAAWMAGLILVFACQLNCYPSEKGYKEISQCLRLLRLMKDHWKSAMNYYQTLTRLFSDLQAGHSGKLKPNPAKRSVSDHTDRSKRPRHASQTNGHAYSPRDMTPSAAIHRALATPNSDYRHSQHQGRYQNYATSRAASSTPDTPGTSQMGMQQSSFHSPGSQRSSSQESTPQGMPHEEPISASQFIFSPPGYDPQQPWPENHIFADPSYSGFTDAQEVDPLLVDPTVNEVDVFGSISWGSLNGDYSYNPFSG